MNFKMLHTRINTHFNNSVKPFKSEDALYHFLAGTQEIIVETQTAFSDLLQESALAIYYVTIFEEKFKLEIRVVQSTQHTSYCFDIYILISKLDSEIYFNAIIDITTQALTDLRKMYNGDWIISDDDLSLSCLT